VDILLDNPLANMYGPYFLVLYGSLTFFTILFITYFKTLADKTDRLPLPAIPHDIDPYEIAYLRGGTNEMARTAVFSLMQKGLVEIKNAGKNAIITRTSNPERRTTTTVEDAALNWFAVSRQPKELFASGGLAETLEPYAGEYLRRLGRQQLITGPEMQSRVSLWKWPAFLLVLGLGGYKALAAVMHGHLNLVGILIIGVIGVVGLAVVGRLPRITKLGNAYLERLQTAFNKLQYQAPAAAVEEGTAPTGGMMGMDPLLLSVGIFGGAVLSGTAYGAHNDVFARSQKENAAAAGSACGAGCGSSCSSGGSSCGSSGCGGGGCGGCGGCS
jgi:uncharacterized protein (TIGR04222 family)